MALAGALAGAPASAAPPGDAEASKGLYLVRKGDCAKAIPLLEEAERVRHRPSSAVALANCRAAAGDLLAASALYRQVAEESPVRGWVRPDYNAAKAAKQKLADVDAKIPTLRLRLATAYEELTVEVDGKRVTDLDQEMRFQPRARPVVKATARGRAPLSEELALEEGERRVFLLKLDSISPTSPGPSSASPTLWLGARYYGAVIPRFVMRIFADGGRTLPVPGGAFTLTTKARRAEITFALGYLSYAMTPTLFKPIGEPDTQWEFVGSTLGAFTATVDFMWTFPFDAGEHVGFRLGAAAGLGWMAIGNMTRVQAYPSPNDPSNFLPCAGPNNPFGTYRYCNGLDKDHYPGYTEPNWFQGGLRPALFPWLVLPQIGLGFRPTRKLAIDLDTGVSLSGFLTSLGFRYGL